MSQIKLKTRYLLLVMILFFIGIHPTTLFASNRISSPDISMESVSKDIIETLQHDGHFTILLDLLEIADLTDMVKESQDITLFAPNDDAFKHLSKKTLNALFKPENQPLLTAILTYHVVPFRITWRDLPGSKLTLRTLFKGYPILLIRSKEDSRILLAVNDAPGLSEIRAEFLRPAYETTNGNIYTLDAVLIPWKVL